MTALARALDLAERLVVAAERIATAMERDRRAASAAVRPVRLAPVVSPEAHRESTAAVARARERRASRGTR